MSENTAIKGIFLFGNTVDCELTRRVDTEAHFGTTVTKFRIRNEDECLHYCLHKVKQLFSLQIVWNCLNLSWFNVSLLNLEREESEKVLFQLKIWTPNQNRALPTKMVAC